ncbi:MAG: hypothetical protein II161_05585 [Erysipelotrichaceae bacterium]|nr:hypothetical protein [Erysipelotrichaceae bacterium]
MVVNVFEQYFEAEGTYNEVDRHAALVMLIADSEAGNIRYEVAVTFFPHNDEEDYAVSYDAYFSEVIFEARGRRSRKREQTFLADFQTRIDEISEREGFKVFWDRPLREARIG